MKYRKIVFAVLSVSMMVFIFYMSSRNGTLSQGDSDFIRIMIGKLFVDGFGDYGPQQIQDFINLVVYPIRKCGHLSEFAVLGASLLMRVTDIKADKNREIQAFLMGTLYRSSDEFHQLFVAGRSGKITDVLIDSVGVVIGITFSAIVFNYFKSKNDN